MSAIAARTFAKGSPALAAGRRLRPQDVGLIASLGLAQVTVVRQPRVRILVTGNELKAPGQPKGRYQVYDANSYMLRGLVARDGGVLDAHIPARATIPMRSAKRCSHPGADVILVSGGSSVGQRRLRAAADRGARRAGDPRRGDAAVEPRGHGPDRRDARVPAARQSGVLPVRLRFLRRPRHSPARRTRGRTGRTARAGAPSPARSFPPSAASTIAASGLVDGRVEPIALSGASILSSTTRADGFVIVPAESEGYGPDAEVTVYLYD